MFKRLMLLLPFLGLTACGPSNYVDYSQQANMDAQRTYQTQYASYNACVQLFTIPGDCYLGTNGLWYSPPYYAWGAVIHHNHMITYGNRVPVGGVWIHPNYHVNVDYSRSRSYVNSRTNYYRTNYHSSSYNRPSYSSNSYRSASYKPATNPYRANNPSVSRIKFGSSSSYTAPSRRSSFSSSSYRSSSFSSNSYRSSSFSSRRH